MLAAEISVGDGLAVMGLAFALLLYGLQTALARRRDVLAARAVLLGVRHGMLQGWGAWFFSTVYGDAEAKEHGQAALDIVRTDKNYNQVFVVPREPLAALVASDAGGDLISNDTVESASLALYWLGVFNQLVQQQTDYNARHIAEIRGDVIDDGQREAIGRGAYSIAALIHGSAIGRANQQGGWYQALTQNVTSNLADLDASASKRWWLTPVAAIASAALLVGLALAGWALVDGNSNDRPHRHGPPFSRAYDD